ncbi:hypothetical protein BD408DRAFT_138615 [Parasitella parasitica]|nr:hypothetical protein BD408DRAFT_138615 [Parasitella parasitica]
MSPTSTINNSSFYSNSYLHPLETTAGIFIERRDSCRKLSITSDLSDQQLTEPTRRASVNNWCQLLSQFDSQPDIVQLIQLCKVEEDRRRQEESKMKMKEYQVICQMQNLQERRFFASKISPNEFDLCSPPLSYE